MRRFGFQFVALSFLLALALRPSYGWQQKAQGGGPDSGESSSLHPQAEESQDTQQTAAYDPLPAEHDLEVGTFYMHKGDLDAAIARFQDAIKSRPNFAEPRLLLGELYEKKGDKATAAKYYKEYLQVLPGARDAKKLQKKIEKLTAH